MSDGFMMFHCQYCDSFDRHHESETRDFPRIWQNLQSWLLGLKERFLGKPFNAQVPCFGPDHQTTNGGSI